MRRILFLYAATLIFTVSFLAPQVYCAEAKHLSKAPVSPEDEQVIEKVRNYITSSGKSIGQIIEESAADSKPIVIQGQKVSLGEPYWDIRKIEGENPGYIVTCFQGATFYSETGNAHGDGAIKREWYYDGKTIYSIFPNDIDKEMPVWDAETKP